nr:hypothetical protein [Tanacetum cinerariifolium]
RTPYSAVTHFYEVIVNGYFGMPMDPLDPYVQLVMEAPHLPDYILGPEAPPSPDYVPEPKAPPSPDYIPRPEYLEYLPPADDVLLAKEQPLPTAVSHTAESPGYITDSEPEIEPEVDDGDDEKSEGDSIKYPTSKGDDDANDDDDDLSEDDADDEDKEESSDSEEKEEKHLALTVPTPALLSSIPASEDSNETKPFEEGIMDYCQSREVHTNTLVTQIEALQKDVSTLQRQQIDDKDRLTRHIQHEHAQRDDAPEDGDSCS